MLLSSKRLSLCDGQADTERETSWETDWWKRPEKTLWFTCSTSVKQRFWGTETFMWQKSDSGPCYMLLSCYKKTDPNPKQSQSCRGLTHNIKDSIHGKRWTDSLKGGFWQHFPVPTPLNASSLMIMDWQYWCLRTEGVYICRNYRITALFPGRWRHNCCRMCHQRTNPTDFFCSAIIWFNALNYDHILSFPAASAELFV